MPTYDIILLSHGKMREANMEREYSIDEILRIFKKRMLLIISITCFAAILGSLVTFFYLTPIYQSTTKLLVNQAKDNQTVMNSNAAQVDSDLKLIDTYNEIIKSSRILSNVSKELGTGITVKQLNKEITVNKTQNSQVVTIVVQDPSANRAAKIANATAQVFQKEIVKIMNIDNVSILDSAIVDHSPVKPQLMTNVAISLVIGLLLGVLIAFSVEYFDRTIKSEKDITEMLGIPVLGHIAIIDDKKIGKRKTYKSVKNEVVRGENIGS
jgi:capsular polysaccharide biosynthesis protein